MNVSATILLATAIFGVGFGLAPGRDGAEMYTIELEPLLVEKMLAEGLPAHTIVPIDDQGNAISVQIIIGNKPLTPIDVKAVHKYRRPPFDDFPIVAPSNDEPIVEPIVDPQGVDPQGKEEMSGDEVLSNQPDRFPTAEANELPINRPVGHTLADETPKSPSDQEKTTLTGDSKKTTDTQVKPAEAPVSKPWLPLLGTAVGLIASLGGNFYLGWIVWDVRDRYRKLLRSSRSEVVS